MSFIDQTNLLVLLCVVLQLFALVLLPKWWKVAACPPLLLLVVIAFDLTSGANLAGLMTHGLLAPLAIAWLLVVLVLFGVVKVVRRMAAPSENSKPPDSTV